MQGYDLGRHKKSRQSNSLFSFTIVRLKHIRFAETLDNIASLTGLVLLGLLFILQIFSSYRTVPLGTKYW